MFLLSSRGTFCQLRSTFILGRRSSLRTACTIHLCGASPREVERITVTSVSESACRFRGNVDVLWRDDCELVDLVRDDAAMSFQLSLISFTDVLQRTKNPSRCPAIPRLPLSPGLPVPRIQPTPRFSITSSVPSRTGARIFSLGTLSTAIAGFNECDKLSVYARTFLTDHRVKSSGSGNAPELTLRAVAPLT